MELPFQNNNLVLPFWMNIQYLLNLTLSWIISLIWRCFFFFFFLCLTKEINKDSCSTYPKYQKENNDNNEPSRTKPNMTNLHIITFRLLVLKVNWIFFLLLVISFIILIISSFPIGVLSFLLIWCILHGRGHRLCRWYLCF